MNEIHTQIDEVWSRYHYDYSVYDVEQVWFYVKICPVNVIIWMLKENKVDINI